jgi:hypothetical protein
MVHKVSLEDVYMIIIIISMEVRGFQFAIPSSLYTVRLNFILFCAPHHWASDLPQLPKILCIDGVCRKGWVPQIWTPMLPCMWHLLLPLHFLSLEIHHPCRLLTMVRDDFLKQCSQFKLFAIHHQAKDVFVTPELLNCAQVFQGWCTVYSINTLRFISLWK